MFDFVLANELKRAARSQNFVTLVVMEPRAVNRAAAVRELAALVARELRETDLLAADDERVWMVLLDADRENSQCVMGRVMSRMQHYQFATPVGLMTGAGCCPTDGADIATLRSAALAARTALPDRAPHPTAEAQ